MPINEDQLGQSTPSSTTPVDLHQPANLEHVSYTTLYVTNSTTLVTDASFYHNNSTDVFTSASVLRHHMTMGVYGADKIHLGIVSSSTKSHFAVQSHTANNLTFSLYGIVRTT